MLKNAYLIEYWDWAYFSSFICMFVFSEVYFCISSCRWLCLSGNNPFSRKFYGRISLKFAVYMWNITLRNIKTNPKLIMLVQNIFPKSNLWLFLGPWVEKNLKLAHLKYCPTIVQIVFIQILGTWSNKISLHSFSLGSQKGRTSTNKKFWKLIL